MIQRCMLSYSLVQNKIPETEDGSDKYFRRETIYGFPNRFEVGNKKSGQRPIKETFN